MLQPRRRLSPMIRVVYSPAEGAISNPERGFFHETDFRGQVLSFASNTNGDTLVRIMVRLDDYRGRELPAPYLAALEETLQQARGAGLKLILRFAYNDGPYPNPEPDAPLPMVLRHMEQLGPVLEANKDVIAWFEAGFIGAWGEWHSSSNQLDTPESKARIRDALFSYFARDRFILFRYPGDIIGWYPQPLSQAEAFTSQPQARTGHHNDCFLASADDEGTYLDDQGQNRISEWQEYLARMTRYVPMAGETCSPNPPRSDCATALYELALLHWTALNEDWHPEVIAGFKKHGCYETIREKLGYRLLLTEGLWPSRLLAGAGFQFRLALKNEGFAAPLLPRPVYLVLLKDGRRVSWLLDVDPRRWEPGQHAIVARVALPQDLPAGRYVLGLWLPDPSPRLRDDPRYAVRLANDGVWDQYTGINVLGEVTVVGGR